MNNAVFGKTMENMRKHRNIKLVTTERRRNYLVWEPNFHTTNFFSQNLLVIEINKTEILRDKPVYLGCSILELGKILLYRFWYHHVKPKYHEKVKFCYMDTDMVVDTYRFGFIVYINKDDIIKILQKMLKLDLIFQIMN